MMTSLQNLPIYFVDEKFSQNYVVISITMYTLYRFVM